MPLPSRMVTLGKILQTPTDISRPRYTCNYFNDENISFLPVTGLFDFVTHYGKYVTKRLGASKRD